MNEQKVEKGRGEKALLTFVSTECVYAHNCIIYLLREMFQMKIRISMCQPSLLPLPLQAPNAGICERETSKTKSSSKFHQGNALHKYIRSRLTNSPEDLPKRRKKEKSRHLQQSNIDNKQNLDLFRIKTKKERFFPT